MNGDRVRGLKEPWRVGGSLMLYPGDTSLGASGGETINCFAPWSPVANIGLRKAMRYDYRGDLIELSAGHMVNLTVTPNHPILTRRGWVLAGEINEGDDLFHCGFSHSKLGSLDINAMQSSAEHLYNSAKVPARIVGNGSVIVDFHGHIPAEDINIVSMPSRLGSDDFSRQLDEFAKRFFKLPDVSKGRLLADRMIRSSLRPFPQKASSGMRVACSRFLELLRQKCGAFSVSLANAEWINPHILQATVDHGPTNSKVSGYSQNGHSFFVKLPDIIKVELSRVRVFFRNCHSRSMRLVSGWSDPHVFKARFDDACADPKELSGGTDARVFCEPFGDGIDNGGSFFSPMVSLLPVKSVRRFHYDGPVFNFESESNILLSNGIVNHNCRCWEQIRIEYDVE
jgi:hypothetical protein